MKKGEKLREDGYLLQIKDLQGEYWCQPSTYRSLRHAVADAAGTVEDMHNYLKVYRDFTSMSGVYVASFWSKSTERPRVHLIVQITEFELLTPAGIAHELEYIRRISRNEPKVLSGR